MKHSTTQGDDAKYKKETCFGCESSLMDHPLNALSECITKTIR